MHESSETFKKYNRNVDDNELKNNFLLAWLNRKQGNKLRRLMTFAWPCLLPKTCVDPATKYHGHLLLSHIIAKFAIHKRIVLQVYISIPNIELINYVL